MMRPLALLLLAGLCLAPAAGWAELYKCQGRDGKTLFTSDRSQCPGASAHEPSGNIQRARPSPAATPAAAPRRPPAHAVDDAAEAQAWRGKRVEAETALRHTEAQLEMLHEVAGWCNRGAEVWAEDQDGLRHGVKCEDVDAQEAALRKEKKRLEAYLAEGLEDECRRAGCLPGWLR